MCQAPPNPGIGARFRSTHSSPERRPPSSGSSSMPRMLRTINTIPAALGGRAVIDISTPEPADLSSIRAATLELHPVLAADHREEPILGEDRAARDMWLHNVETFRQVDGPIAVGCVPGVNRSEGPCLELDHPG